MRAYGEFAFGSHVRALVKVEQQSEQHSRCSEKRSKNSMDSVDENEAAKTLRSLFTKDSHFGKLALYH